MCYNHPIFFRAEISAFSLTIGTGEYMYSTVMTSIVEGINTLPIFVEADISDGMPMFDMVGNLGPEVREARERVRTALHNCGIILPAKRITINLAPGNIRKNGTAFEIASTPVKLAEPLEKALSKRMIEIPGTVDPI